MEKIVLEAQIRDNKVSPLYLRKNRKIPAVYYGNNQKNLNLEMDYQSFRKAYLKAGGNQIIELMIEGKKTPVLVQDMQVNPVTDTYEHVDFLHVNMNEEVTAMIPIEITGVSPAVKDLGGVLTTLKDEIEVRCLPANLPQSIEVDISSLAEIHSSIHVSDLKVPSKVEILDGPEGVVLTVSAQRQEEAETPVAVPEAGAAAATPEAPAAEGGEAAKE